MATQQHDVIDILVQDHREVEEMFQELEGLRGRTGEEDRKRRKELVDKVTIELVRHAVAEETQVYPAVKQKVSDDEAEREAAGAAPACGQADARVPCRRGNEGSCRWSPPGRRTPPRTSSRPLPAPRRAGSWPPSSCT
jgi:hypothetical protein